MYLTHREIKENSFLMINYENGNKEPYFVFKISIGTITGATRLLGYTVPQIILKPEKCLNGTESMQVFYIENDTAKGKDKQVLGYQKLNNKDKEELQQRLSQIPGMVSKIV